MLRLSELAGDLGGATRELGSVAEGLHRAGHSEIADEVELATKRASEAHGLLQEKIEKVAEQSACPECGAAPVKLLGESCERAEEKMPIEDYYGDGSKYVAVGAHNQGWECPDCGEMDAEPCIHD